jgi:hypothetical protein
LISKIKAAVSLDSVIADVHNDDIIKKKLLLHKIIFPFKQKQLLIKALSAVKQFSINNVDYALCIFGNL